jgi:hypothetical protein
MNEANIMRDIQITLTTQKTRLWRNNIGTAWRGKVTRLSNGDILIRDPVLVHFGLVPGSGDLIGLQSVIVTEEMIGRILAVFVSVEAKRGPKSERSEAQVNFVDTVRDLGGLAGFACSIDEARQILTL